jgi:hypothetical protein
MADIQPLGGKFFPGVLNVQLAENDAVIAIAVNAGTMHNEFFTRFRQFQVDGDKTRLGKNYLAELEKQGAITNQEAAQLGQIVDVVQSDADNQTIAKRVDAIYQGMMSQPGALSESAAAIAGIAASSTKWAHDNGGDVAAISPGDIADAIVGVYLGGMVGGIIGGSLVRSKARDVD